LSRKPRAGVWLALLAAPSVALLNLSVSYALSALACDPSISLPLNATSALSLVLTILMTLAAARAWPRHAAPGEEPTGGPAVGTTFLPTLATAIGALSSLVIFAQWLAVWILPHCAA
jgi:hypothetical protein